MTLTDKERSLLLRALDKASVPVEAEKAAEALIASLRKRGVNGYEFLGEIKKAYADPRPAAPPTATPPPKPTPKAESKPKATESRSRWERWCKQCGVEPEPLSQEPRKDPLFTPSVVILSLLLLGFAIGCPFLGVPLLVFSIPVLLRSRTENLVFQ